MKKSIVVVVMALGLNAHAGLGDFFDFAKIGQGLLLIADSINEGLEKIHVIQKENVDVESQWTAVCTTTVSLNKSVEAVSQLVEKYNFGGNVCAPITNVLNLQAQIINHCQAYYTDTVPMNSDFVLAAFSQTLEDSTKILTQCYPFLNNNPFAN